MTFNRIQATFMCLAAILLLSCNGANTEEETKKYVHIPPELPSHVYDQLEDGDIILRKGSGPLSFHIMNATKEEYSHCGIIVKEQDKWRVIHSMGGSVSKKEKDGVQIMDLDKFTTYAADSMLYICRANYQDSIGKEIRNHAYTYLENETPFDHSFSLFTKDKIYCSELLFYILRDITGKNQFKIRKKNRSYLLLFETFFDESKYTPIFDLKHMN